MAIICAMSFEMSAVRYLLDKEDPRGLSRQPGDHNTYILGEMRGHNVVLACLPGQQGKGAAAIVATNLARTFQSVNLRFFVGIGGGVPCTGNDIRLGDVVVGMPSVQYGGVVQYDLGKETESADPLGGFILKGYLRPPPLALVGAVEAMRSDHDVQDNKIADFVGDWLARGSKLVKFKRPSVDLDILFQATYPHVRSAVPGAKDLSCKDNCDRTKAVGRTARDDPSESVIHCDLIASGDSVVKNATKRDEIARRVGGNVLCFEMEAAGLLTGYEGLVVRGVSDYCDSHKNDDWHYYAAAAAAACAKEILERLGPDAEVATVSTSQGSKPDSQDADRTGALRPKTSQTNTLSGRGVQNTGFGTFSVGGNVNIAQ